MAIDGLSHDPDEIPEPDSVRPADKPPGKPSQDRASEKADQPPCSSTPDKDPEKAELTRAVGELASENADLYNKVDLLTAELKTEKARFSAWAKEVARDKEETAKLLEEQTSRSDELAERVAQLEHALAKKLGAGSAGAPERVVGKQDALENQTAKKNSNRPELTNELNP